MARTSPGVNASHPTPTENPDRGECDAPDRLGALRGTIATNICLACVNAITGLLAARLLGPTGRGELAAIQLWPMFLATMCLLGLPDALVYFSSADRQRAGRSLGTAITLAVLAAAAAMLIGFLAMDILLPSQSDNVVRAARLYLLFCPVFVFAGLPFHILRGVDAFGLWNAIRIAPTLLWLAILLASGAAGNANASQLTMWYLGAMALLIAPIAALTMRRVPGPYRPDRALVRPLVRYGLPSMATSVPQILNLRLDQIVMAAFIPTRQLGYYVAAVAWSAAVSPALMAVGSVLFPWVASQGDPDQRAAVVARVCRLTVLFAAALVTVVGVVTRPGLTLVFGQSFASATRAAMILVVASGLLGIAFVLEEGLRGLGAPSAVLGAELVGMVASAAGLAVLLPAFGISGAAAASALAYAIIVVCLVRRTARILDLRYRDLLRPTRLDVGIAWAGLSRALGRRSRQRRIASHP